MTPLPEVLPLPDPIPLPTLILTLFIFVSCSSNDTSDFELNQNLYENNKLNLFADKIIIDMINGNIKIQMLDNSKKVKLISRNEFN